MKYQFLGVTGCPTGIAHTFMAAEALENAAKNKNVTIKVETHGQRGTENEFSKKEIDEAEVIIIAADKNVNIDRFKGKKVINVSVSKGIKQANQLLDQAISGDVSIYQSTNNQLDNSEHQENTSSNMWHKIYVHLMNGVSHMLPFVVAGGVMTAISFMFGIYSADPKSDQYNVIAEQMNTIGGLAMGLMVPILSAYIAQSIANRPGLVIGFIVGMIADTNGTGFLGGIAGGFLAGGIVLLLQKSLKNLPKSLDGLKAIFLLPVLGIFIAGFIMWYLSVPMEFINKGMMNFLAGFQDSNPIILGLIVGIMCAFDMGGPVNKAAYVTGTALLAQGNHLFMAGVSAACIVPPLATGFSVLLSRKYYSQSETSAGLVNFLLGSTHITEGAIPFAAKRPFIIIPILMVGSSIAAILTYMLKVEVPAPHGGFIVLPVVTHPIFWVVSIIIGALVAGILMSIEQKRYVTKSNESDEQSKIKSTNNLVDSKRVFLNKSFNNKESALEFIAQQSVETNVSDNFNSVFAGLKAREAESSTGMENGIAIPHVSDKSISTSSLIVVKMGNEIEWPSLDEKPTNFLISILVPENNGEEHLNILANLSRKLMDKEFTNQLISSNSNEEIVNLLSGVNKK
ncbi:fructose-specific PTS transporter subunit EIIC [Mammaliicoccus sciuri]|uniref:fructose-specific PTS transporter subunit EIIC n=1 Tax=Mammaliicoccus sciuri TaxID=1296 RepID=UPI002DBA5C82|nr:fructose-specific PTS transporter subunit EIIC [Mammaliicoccus sciuri]MEB8132878.1 fructose-specific PTS transporter subunit EIIC [Mammaliicoccus sciuri]